MLTMSTAPHKVRSILELDIICIRKTMLTSYSHRYIELRHVVCRNKAAARSLQTEHASRVASLETVMDDIANIQSSIGAISEKLSVIIGITHYVRPFHSLDLMKLLHTL